MTDIKPIPTADELFDGKTRMLARYTDGTGWCSFNPSITHTQEHGYLVLLRSANGYLEDHRPEFQTALGREIESPDSYLNPNEFKTMPMMTAIWKGSREYRNRMFIAKLDAKKLILGNMHEVDMSQTDEAALPMKLERGLEDGRIYSDGTSLRISATAYEPHYIPCARISNVQLHVPSIDKAYTTGFEFYDSPLGDDAVEKNWMPVDKGLMPEKSRPSFDYIYNTGKTFTISTRKVEEVGGFELPLRGGSQLIPLEDGTFLAIMHQLVSNEVIRFASTTKSNLFRRRYNHRFVRFSAKGQVLEVSDPFNFINKSIEFASGLAHYGDRLLVTFGALDSSAHISSLSTELVLSSLRRPRI